MSLVDLADLPSALRALPAAPAVLGAAATAGVDAYLVGGAVRDLLLGATPLDLDVAVVGSAEVARLARALGSDVRAHARFGTATVSAGDGSRIDLAATRRERYPRPGALPEVSAAGLAEDLRRRDFSVNAIALGLSGEDTGRVVAVDGALEDLAAGRLRVLHKASFRDDPTRLLRLARYVGRLGFCVEAGTAALVGAAVGGGALGTVSGERIGRELELLGSEADPVAGFAALRELGIGAALGGGLGLAAGVGEALARRALALLPADGDAVALVLGLAIGGVGGSSSVEREISPLGLAARRRDAALAVAGPQPGRLAEALGGARRPSEVDEALRGAPVEAVAVAVALAGATDPAAADRARDWLRDWRHTTLAIDGADLIAAGIPAGPAIAAGLRAARAARLDGEAADREAQLAVALRAAVGGE